jgi:hypothetical protein
VADCALLPLAVAVPVAEPLGVDLPVPGLAAWGVAETVVALLEEPLGDGLAEGQPEEVGLAVAAAEDLAALELAEDDGAGRERDEAAVGPALGSLLGLAAGLGGRLDSGGRTWVTSLTTGSGLSGRAETPSR